MHVGDIQRIRRFHRLGVRISAADNEALGVFRVLFLTLRGRIRFLQTLHNRHVFRRFRPRKKGYHDIVATGQRTSDGLESHPTHDDGMAGRLLTEILHVSGKVPQQLVPAADGLVVGNGDDNTFFHNSIRQRGL